MAHTNTLSHFSQSEGGGAARQKMARFFSAKKTHSDKSSKLLRSEGERVRLGSINNYVDHLNFTAPSLTDYLTPLLHVGVNNWSTQQMKMATTLTTPFNLKIVVLTVRIVVPGVLTL